LFLWSDGGFLTCVDSSTGDIKYQERVGGNFFGSPVVVEDRIYCISTTGEVVVVKASDEFEVLARNALDELSHATPAIADGCMYLRTEKHLISLGGKSGS
jgi:outer membrane protein assembly factor BamB